MALPRPHHTIRTTTIGRVALLGGLLTVTAATRQTVPVTTLSKPLAEFPEGFTNLQSLRELRDGRVMTVEACERVVKLLDLAIGVVQQVGRTGAGPGEYRSPGRLLALPGDSAVIYDAGNRRFLVIHPDGKPGGFFDPLPTVTETRGTAMVVTSSFNPSRSDARGRFYASAGGYQAGETGPVRTDSARVERWDHYTGKRDTVTWYRQLGRIGPITPGEQDIPFTTGTQWAVAPDGRVALVNPEDYHVEFITSSGARSSGKPIPFTPVRVSDGHRKQWHDDQRPACGGSGVLSMTMPDGRTITGRAMAHPEPKEWPEFLPPFLSGAAVFAPDGLLWVRRTVAADDLPAYDLIDGTGRVTHRVVLAKRAKLLGFGNGTVYVVRVDEDDLQYLQRYRLPITERP